MIEKLETVRRLMNNPGEWDYTGANELYAGVDIGTWKTIVVVVDEEGTPRAVSMRHADVVRSGMILDYFGALQIVNELMNEIRGTTDLPIVKGATSYPPQTASSNIDTTTYILEGAGLEVLNVLDEPTAANRVLGLENGAVVDVGGGTTGVAVFKDGAVCYSNDEATGGIHLSLVLSGSLKISLEEAEAVKSDKTRNSGILPVVRPVIEKMAGIVEGYLNECGHHENIWLVGGTCELTGFADIFGRSMGREVSLAPFSQGVTPLGIALSCLEEMGEKVNPSYVPLQKVV
jgi:ethanolamine utilization protein EutJ